MKLTKKLETHILELYHKYWDAYLNGNMRIMSSLMDENIQMIGSGNGEVFKNKKETVKYYKETADQVSGKSEIRNRNIRVSAAGSNILVIEESEFFVLIDTRWTFYGEGRISTLFDKSKDKWKIIQQHGSLPDARTGGGEQLNTDKIKTENLRLKDAIKRRTIELENKNRELEIEAALEKVRAIAMGMKEPADMLDVCRIISDQLQILGIKNIRNVQTAIINEKKGTYLNYQYFAEYDKGTVEETEYHKHPKVFEMVQEMKKSGDGVFTGKLEGKELNKFRVYRKKDKQFPDPVLDEAVSMHYCFYSIGSGGLGLSTYNSLPKAGLAIFKRFHKVFTLAYRRFLDISQAEAQAREAQIELALERVRARTMAMQKSDELSETAFVLFQQFALLGAGPEQLTIGTVDEPEGVIELWLTLGGNQTNRLFKVPIDEPIVINKIFTGWKNRKKSTVIDISGDELIAYNDFRNNIIDFKKQNDFKNSHSEEQRRVIHIAYFSSGFLSLSAPEPRPAETIKLLERFAGVFDGTYTRFLDLQKAEAQAKEAQIEAALEKVRSRSLAMHTTNELGDVVTVIVEKLKDLGVVLDANGIVLCTYFHESKDVLHWMASPDFSFAGSYLLPYFDHPIFNDAWQSKESGAEYFSKAYSVEEKNSFFEYAFEYSDYRKFPEEFKKWIFQNDQHILSFAWQKNSAILIPSHTGVLPSEEDIKILKRFAKVFEQSYVRFLDLQKAEAQAREAQIEAAMEKVRARAMAMQKPQELVAVAQLLREEMGLLGVEELETSSIYIHNEKSETTECWYAIQDIREKENKLITDHMTIKLKDTWVGKEMLKFYTSGQKQTSILMQGGNRKEWINYCAEQSKVFKGYDGDEIPERTYHLLKFSNGYMGAASPGDISAESWELLKRATSVFSLAYTRFSDLQQAEAQAREAQIEAALERVRARTMAMHKSNELAQTAAHLFAQLSDLGIKSHRCNLAIVDAELNILSTLVNNEKWKRYSIGQLYTVRWFSVLKDMYDGWKSKKSRSYY